MSTEHQRYAPDQGTRKRASRVRMTVMMGGLVLIIAAPEARANPEMDQPLTSARTLLEAQFYGSKPADTTDRNRSRRGGESQRSSDENKGHARKKKKARVRKKARVKKKKADRKGRGDGKSRHVTVDAPPPPPSASQLSNPVCSEKMLPPCDEIKGVLDPVAADLKRFVDAATKRCAGAKEGLLACDELTHAEDGRQSRLDSFLWSLSLYLNLASSCQKRPGSKFSKSKVLEQVFTSLGSEEARRKAFFNKWFKLSGGVASFELAINLVRAVQSKTLSGEAAGLFRKLNLKADKYKEKVSEEDLEKLIKALAGLDEKTRLTFQEHAPAVMAQRAKVARKMSQLRTHGKFAVVALDAGGRALAPGKGGCTAELARLIGTKLHTGLLDEGLRFTRESHHAGPVAALASKASSLPLSVNNQHLALPGALMGKVQALGIGAVLAVRGGPRGTVTVVFLDGKVAAAFRENLPGKLPPCANHKQFRGAVFRRVTPMLVRSVAVRTATLDRVWASIRGVVRLDQARELAPGVLLRRMLPFDFEWLWGHGPIQPANLCLREVSRDGQAAGWALALEDELKEAFSHQLEGVPWKGRCEAEALPEEGQAILEWRSLQAPATTVGGRKPPQLVQVGFTYAPPGYKPGDVKTRLPEVELELGQHHPGDLARAVAYILTLYLRPPPPGGAHAAPPEAPPCKAPPAPPPRPPKKSTAPGQTARLPTWLVGASGAVPALPLALEPALADRTWYAIIQVALVLADLGLMAGIVVEESNRRAAWTEANLVGTPEAYDRIDGHQAAVYGLAASMGGLSVLNIILTSVVHHYLVPRSSSQASLAPVVTGNGAGLNLRIRWP